MEARREAGEEPGYVAESIGLPVVTGQETELTLYAVASVSGEAGRYVATHEPVGPASRG